MREDGCYYAWKFVACHCANMSSQIEGIDFDQPYSPIAHADSFRINISIADMYRLTARILDVSNEFKNKFFPFHERGCVNPTHYYIDWFGISYPNVPLNRDDGQFYIQCMDIIQGKKPDQRKWNRLLDAVVTMVKYNRSKIDHDIYIKVFSDGKVSYITVSTNDFLNTTNNETEFP